MNTNFLTLTYWFSATPGNMAPGAIKLFTLFLLGLFALAFIAYLRGKRKQDVYYKGWDQIFNFAAINLAIGLLLFFFFYESVPYLSLRFSALLWFVIMIYWAYTITHAFKEVPAKLEKRKQEKEYKKYIP